MIFSAKSVQRFRGLSCSWRAALSSASFHDLRSQRANRPGQLKVFFRPTNQTFEGKGSSYFYAWQPGSEAAKKLMPHSFRRPALLTKPLHGLVLIRCANTGYHICSPSTGQTLALPDTNKPLPRTICRPASHWQRRAASQLQATLPCYSYRRVAYGFGYCSVTGLHKAVRLFSILVDQDSRFGPNYCEIYSPHKFPYWRRTTQQPPVCVVDEEDPGVFLNGCVHYLCSDGHIMTFDVSSETFGSLLPPPNPKDAPAKMMELVGCLCVFHGDMRSYDETYYIWLLTNYKQQQWDQLCRIDTTGWTGPLLSWWIAPLGTYNGDDRQKKVMLGTSTCHVFAINVPNGSAPEILFSPDEAITVNCRDYGNGMPIFGVLDERLVPVRCAIGWPCHERRVKFGLTSSSKSMLTWSVVELSFVRGEWRAMVKDDHFIYSVALCCTCKLE